ncbi:helix-turn-helix domain-containing protein [Pacificimonas sp. ICDLI1SI03]
MLGNDLLRGAKAAAEYTGLPMRTIYHLAEIGEIPCRKKGGNLFFRKSEMDRAFSAEVETN